MPDSPLSQSETSALWERGRGLLRAFGLEGLSNAEAKARAEVLGGRMGAMTAGEYTDLTRFLNANDEELGL